MNQPSDRADIPQTADPLPSWNDGPARRSIVEFVATVTKPGSPEFVPIAERITVFDNDGTLWAEQPTFFQALFAFDRIRQLAPQHPEWQTREPFASVLRGDEKSALAAGMHALVEMAVASHAGTTTEEFETIVRDWIATARHPKTGKLYTEMVYQPMLELLAYLRANGFKTFIVSAGGHRVHARLQRTGLWRPARAGHWHQHQDEVRAEGREAGAGASAGNQLH